MHQTRNKCAASLLVIEGQAELFGEETAFLHLLVEAIFAVRKQVKRNRETKRGNQWKISKKERNLPEKKGEMMLAGHKTSSFFLKPTPFYLLAWKFSGFRKLCCVAV